MRQMPGENVFVWDVKHVNDIFLIRAAFIYIFVLFLYMYIMWIASLCQKLIHFIIFIWENM